MRTWPASSSDEQMLDLKLPAAWSNGKAYRVDGTALTGDAPLAVSFTRGDQMLAVIRGTVYSREWCVFVRGLVVVVRCRQWRPPSTSRLD